MKAPSTERRSGRRLRDLSLFWKLLLPFLVLILFLGSVGALLIVRDLSARARTALDRDLLRQSVDARSHLRDRELYMLEGANFAANLEDMAESIERRDVKGTRDQLRSVLALKSELDVVFVTDIAGAELVRLTGPQSSIPAGRSGNGWRRNPLITGAFRSVTGDRSAGLLDVDGKTVAAVVAPVCSAREDCRPAGVAVVGMGIDRLADEALAAASPRESRSRTGVALYDANQRPLSASGLAMPGNPPAGGQTTLARRIGKVGGEEIAAVYLPLELRGRPVGTLGVSLPTAPAFASVRGAGLRLALVLLAAAIGIVGIGLILSRFILAQVRPLVTSSRSLGRGELAARAPILSDDELGELARHFNEMADELQASHGRLESRVAERTGEIERLLRERTEFFTAISHEFRTPLAVILGRTKMMLSPRYRKSGKPQAEEVRTIKESGEQLLQLVNEILELARAESGRVDLDLSEVSLDGIVDDLRATLQGLASARNLRLHVHLPPGLPPVWADGERVRQILLNLVDNAVKYTPAGGHVDLSAARLNGTVELHVSDTGVGIPEDVGERIFEPFYRAPGVRTQHGEAASGLGLALARRLVEAHGGTLSYDAREGGGTTFTARFPIAAGARDNAKVSQNEEFASDIIAKAL